MFWKQSILGPLPPPPLPRFRFRQSVVISLLAIPPTNLEAADTANSFRFRFQNLSDRGVVSFPLVKGEKSYLSWGSGVLFKGLMERCLFWGVEGETDRERSWWSDRRNEEKKTDWDQERHQKKDKEKIDTFLQYLRKCERQIDKTRMEIDKRQTKIRRRAIDQRESKREREREKIKFS